MKANLRSIVLGSVWFFLAGSAGALVLDGSVHWQHGIWFAVAAVGWLLILLFSGASGQTARGAATAVSVGGAERQTLAEVQQLLAGIAVGLPAQYDATRGELSRVQAMLAEAISALMTSFQGMYEHTRRQRDMTIAVTEGGATRPTADSSTILYRALRMPWSVWFRAC